MLVYGDLERTTSPGEMLDELAGACVRVGAFSPGTERHARAARLLIDAGELAQGLIDAAFARRGRDAWGRVEDASARLVFDAARVLLQSSRGESELGVSFVRSGIEALRRARLPRAITVKVPEGYAFYALYPEMYAAAADLEAGEPDDFIVLGIRSIGTSLASVVAAASGAARPPITLRPVGHPFQRALAVAPALGRRILARAGSARYAIVDEGPGLSGSSFGAVADWLEDAGVDPARIVFFPSHGGEPGPAASERHRARWRAATRRAVDFERVFLDGPRPKLASLLKECAGAPVASIEDVAGGRWRSKLHGSEAEWPPAWPGQERRKYIVQAGGRALLAKFAGLGRYGEALWSRAQRLGRAGLIPRPRGLCYGFIVSDWLAKARPLRLEGAAAWAGGALFDRERLVSEVGRYLAFLARELREAHGGAPPARLLAMARHNTSARLGSATAAQLDRWEEHLPAITRATRVIATDNRLHAWEWLVLPDGRLLKADALDHHAAHDLIGPQDLAWDIAGASVELRLGEEEQGALVEAIARASPYRADPEVLPFYTACYLAFQLGYYSMAAWAIGASDPAELARVEAAADWYASHLRGLLEGGPTLARQ